MATSPVPTRTRAAGRASRVVSQRTGETDWAQVNWAVPVSSSLLVSVAPAQAATRKGRVRTAMVVAE